MFDAITRFAVRQRWLVVFGTIALIGAGPASLTVARGLAPMGYSIDIYDNQFAGGGMMRSQIPAFRLPVEVLDEEVKIDFDDQFSYGLNAGIDVPFGSDSSWLFTAALKYLVSDLKESGGPREIAIDPLIASIGIGYRF